MKAVESVYARSESDDHKVFLYKEYIEDNYECLKESKLLDSFWYENEKEIKAASNMKRKLDYVLYKDRPEALRPTIKDRRLSNTLSQNNIIDLSNTGNASQRAVIPNFEQLANEAKFETLPNLHEKVIHCINGIFTKTRTSAYQKYLKSLSYQNQCPPDALYIYLVISCILNEHSLNPEAFDFSTQSMVLSEQDYCLIWGPILKILFSATCVKLKSGDTVLSDIDRGYKVDTRLGIMINQKFVDIASIEVGRKPSSSKIK